MIKWYSNQVVGIFFDDIPHVCMRYSLPSQTKKEKEFIKKYPFVNKRTLFIELADYKKSKNYSFSIPKGYCYDGASIPRLFWRVIGSNTDNRFLIAALVHDVLCEHHEYIDNDRRFSTEVFNALLESSDVSCCQRFLMKHSVNVFQKFFCNWNQGQKKRKDLNVKDGKI